MLECGHRCSPQLSVAMAMLVDASSTPQAWASSSPAASAALTPLRRDEGCVASPTFGAGGLDGCAASTGRPI